jgi:hypothetical protein
VPPGVSDCRLLGEGGGWREDVDVSAGSNRVSFEELGGRDGVPSSASARALPTADTGIRDKVRVGLGGRLNEGEGMPSRIPFSSPGSRLGRGKLESGPARLRRTSWLDRRFILIDVCAVVGTKDDGGGEDVDAAIVL